MDNVTCEQINEQPTPAGVLEKRKKRRIPLIKRLKRKPHISRCTGDYEWYTPSEIVEAAREVMGEIDCDPASCDYANQTVKARKYFSKENDGRKQQWGKRVWLNPPYSKPLCGEFCGLLLDKLSSGEVEEACLLVNSSTGSLWFHGALDAASAVCFLKGRIKFIKPDGKPVNKPVSYSTMLYFGKHVRKFQSVFGKLGIIRGQICDEGNDRPGIALPQSSNLAALN